MSRVFFVIALLLFSFGCNAPVTKHKPAEPYVVDSSSVDQANNSLTAHITLDPPVTEESAKAAAESFINQYKDKYKTIIVRAFTRSEQQTPYVVSYLAEGTISHQVNRQLEPQKIPTH